MHASSDALRNQIIKIIRPKRNHAEEEEEEEMKKRKLYQQPTPSGLEGNLRN